VSNPSEQAKAEDVDDNVQGKTTKGSNDSALYELTKARNEEANKRGKNVGTRPLAHRVFCPQALAFLFFFGHSSLTTSHKAEKWGVIAQATAKKIVPVKRTGKSARTLAGTSGVFARTSRSNARA
jgi:hypothetical protein